jgi:hypothetical protein
LSSSTSADDGGRGLIVLEQDRVIALDAAARGRGVVPGMRRGGALTLAPNADMRVREPALRGRNRARRRVCPAAIVSVCRVIG